jgi:hypothetical protein
MANAAEIIIRARDEFSAMTAKARQEFGGLVDQYGKPLSNPFEKVEEGAHHASSGMHEAKESAELLKHELGIEMPRALTNLIAQSQTLGPLLTASLSAVAAVSLIQVLTQIPEIFQSMIGAVTGWNEHAQKAFETQIDLNKKYVDLLKEAEQTQIRLAVRAGKLTEAGGIGQNIQTTQAALQEAQRTVTQYQNEKNRRENLPTLLEQARHRRLTEDEQGRLTGPSGMAAMSDKDIAAELTKATTQVSDLDQALRKLQTVELPVAIFEDTKKASDEAKKRVEDLKQKLETAETAFFNWTVQMRIHAKALSDAEVKELQKAGDELIRTQQGAAEAQKALTDTMFHGGMQLFAKTAEEQEKQNKLAAEGATFAGKAWAKEIEELRKKHEEFVRSFRESAGHVWDDFFIRGSGILDSLANAAKGILNTIGRTLFQDFAAGLVGGKSSTGGLTGGVTQLGGLLGGRIGLSRLLTGFGAKGAAGALAADVAGGGGILGGGTAGLAGGAAAGGAGLLGLTWAGPVGGVTGLGVGGSVSGFLGLGGAAGLFGLGAATIPVLGAIAAGAFFGLRALLGHHTQEAPFTRDPHEVERNRSVLFFTNLQESMDKFTGGVDAFVQKVQSVKPGDVVMAGMPSAFQSSNSFRRTIAGTLLDDA